MIEFTHSSFLPYVIFSAFVVFLAYVMLVRRRNRVLRLRSPKNSGRIFGTFRLGCYTVTIALIALGVGLSLLQPYQKRVEPYTEYEPLDIVLAEDLSLSTLAQATPDPCGPSRLAVMRREMLGFVELLEKERKDRVGLVVFARLGYRLIPALTTDYHFVRSGIEESDENFVRSLMQGTNTWDAVVEAAKMFNKKSQNKRVLVILTDGEPDAPPEVLAESRTEALTALSELGKISIYVIGIGDPSANYPIPEKRQSDGCPSEFFTQTEGDGSGQIIFTRPDQAALGMLAEQLGGTYRHSVSGKELTALLSESVGKERVPIGTKYREMYADLTEYIIWAVLFLMFVSMIIKSP